MKKDDLAFKKLNQALSMAPDSALVQRNLARIYLKKNKPNDALTAATKAFTVDSHNHENRLVLTSALAASGEKVKALELVESIIKANNDYAEAYATRGLLRLQNQDLKKALIDFEHALSIKPHLVQLWALSAKLYYQEKNLLKAITALKQALVIEPDNIDYMVDIGEFYRQAGKTEQSLSNLSKAVELAPESENAWINYGTVLQQLERQTEAKAAYHHALKINPNKPELLNNLGAMAKSAGDLEESVEYFTKAIQLNPESAEAHSNLGNTLNNLGQLEAAVKSYEKALTIKPDNAHAHSNLGNTLKELGQLEAAVKSYEKALAIKPDFAEVHYNLGVTLNDLGQLDAAVKSYEQALAIKPDFADAHYNLGNTLKELGQLDAAVKSYEQALAIKPDYAEAHYNLGVTLQELGQLDAAVKSYGQALAIKPDFAEAWGNVFFTAKALNLSTTQNTWLESYKKTLGAAILNSIHFKILEYRLNAFTPHTVDDCFNDAINALPLKTTEDIQNPSPIHQNKKPILISDNMVALIHFGRSGTGLLHSLIDNHPEISTLPSIYFSEYYHTDVWGKLTAQGWDQLPENFIKQFAVLFDARSSVPIPSIDKPIAHLGQKEGMVNVGANRDEVLTVDQNRFCAELQKLMRSYPSLTPQNFFTLAHSAYEKVLNKTSKKQSIFYHIHNPSPYAKLNFLRYNPEAKLLMMVREPIQSCESWVKKVIKKSSANTHSRIVTLLFDIDQIAFRRFDSIGVRLEDLKRFPKETMAALCDWMGIEDSPTLYEMTAQGKKWWGDPTSPDYGKEGMSPFDDSAITRKVGNSVFSEQDQFILRTLFYPFSVRFGYVEANLDQFKKDLQTIKPLLDKPFGFQVKLAENLNQDL